MRVESLIEADDLAPGERWVTIRGNAVKINGDGVVLSGPDELKGTKLGGEPAAKPKQTDSPEFKAWFGDSKVVDKDGKPLVVYHGTDEDFHSFDSTKAGSRNVDTRGIFFTQDPEVAKTYGGRVKAVYLNITDPVEVDFGGKSSVYFNGEHHTPGQLANRIAAINDDLENHYSLGDDLTDELRNHGWETFVSSRIDGAIFKNIDDAKAGIFGTGKSTNHFVAFRPNQIKSAIKNKGTFNPASDDIRESRDRTPSLEQLRTASETKLQRILASLDKRHRQQLEQAIADAGSVRDIPEIVWKQIQFEIEEETAAAIILMMVAADEWTDDELRRQGLDADDMDTVSRYERYSTTAARRAQDMAQQTTLTARMKLARKIEDAMLDPNRGDTGELTKRGIKDALDDVFNQSRRETLATDQTTGSFSTGQKGAAERLGGDGASTTAGQKVTIELRWQTELDDRVCTRCSPLHEQPEEVWGKVFPNGPGPEAHPNCRCFFRSVVTVEAIE